MLINEKANFSVIYTHTHIQFISVNQKMLTVRFRKYVPLFSVLPNTDAKLFSVTKATFDITGVVVGLTAPNAKK